MCLKLTKLTLPSLWYCTLNQPWHRAKVISHTNKRIFEVKENFKCGKCVSDRCLAVIYAEIRSMSSVWLNVNSLSGFDKRGSEAQQLEKPEHLVLYTGFVYPSDLPGYLFIRPALWTMGRPFGQQTVPARPVPGLCVAVLFISVSRLPSKLALLAHHASLMVYQRCSTTETKCFHKTVIHVFRLFDGRQIIIQCQNTEQQSCF